MNNCLFLIKSFSFSPSDGQTNKKEKLINMSCRKVFHCLSIDRGFWPPIENIQLQILKYSWISYSRSFNRSPCSFVAPLLYPQHPWLNRKQLFSIYLKLKPKQMHFFLLSCLAKMQKCAFKCNSRMTYQTSLEFPIRCGPLLPPFQPNCR